MKMIHIDEPRIDSDDFLYHSGGEYFVATYESEVGHRMLLTWYCEYTGKWTSQDRVIVDIVETYHGDLIIFEPYTGSFKTKLFGLRVWVAGLLCPLDYNQDVAADCLQYEMANS